MSLNRLKAILILFISYIIIFNRINDIVIGLRKCDDV